MDFSVLAKEFGVSEESLKGFSEGIVSIFQRNPKAMEVFLNGTEEEKSMVMNKAVEIYMENGKQFVELVLSGDKTAMNAIKGALNG